MNVPIDPSTNIPSHPPAYTASSSVENGAANVNASIANQSRLAAQINEISPSHGQPSAPSDLPAYSQIA